jgi:1-acyl-sn-glycerol-3-phosphate acyltransferase
LSVLAQALIVYETLKISIPVIVDSALGRLDRSRVDRRLKSWGQRVLDISDLKLDVEGVDAIDWSRAYIVLSNHQSLLDIPVVAVTVPGSLRFVAKKELFRVPIWGRAMRQSGIISLDRGDRESAIRSLRAAAETLRQGIHIWMAPEGTRSLDGKLGKLKKGGFVLAMDTGARILPMAISGTLNVRRKHERNLVKGVHARVVFGAPIEVAGRDRDGLMAEVEAFYRANVPGA